MAFSMNIAIQVDIIFSITGWIATACSTAVWALAWFCAIIWRIGGRAGAAWPGLAWLWSASTSGEGDRGEVQAVSTPNGPTLRKGRPQPVLDFSPIDTP